MKKKKIIFHSDYPANKTGFGRNLKSLMTYLYKTGKYELVNYTPSMIWKSPEYKRFPWKTYGAIPDNSVEQQAIQSSPDEAYKRQVYYGAYKIDELIKVEKPDVYIGTNDIWGLDYCVSRKWWNKIHSIFHVTLDSTPLLPSALSVADKVKNYYMWSDFATKEMHRLGHKHVNTIYGAIDDICFKNLGQKKKQDLRLKYNLDKDAFIIGFVFRNQIRKEVFALLGGFKQFLAQNPEANAYLLLHTHWSEPAGWDIPRLIEEYKIPKEKILTTYVCKNCGEIEIKPFSGQDKDCRFCNSEKSQITCNIEIGATEEQLNEVYNLMDCYTQVFNAGGLEIPIIEAMYTELPVAVTNYACGETYCNQDFVYPLEFAWTKQIGTQFNRASTYEFSICKFLNKIYRMSKDKRQDIGAQARKWALSNFSISSVGKKWEEIIDNLPEINWDFNFEEEKKDPESLVSQNSDNFLWIKELYRKILKMEEPDDSDGIKYWLQVLKKGGSRQQVLDYFRNVAKQENEKNKKIYIEDFFDKETKGKRVLFVAKESGGDIYYIKSLFASAKELYPNHFIYFATDPKFAEIVESDPHVYKTIPWQQIYENEMEMRKYVEALFIPAIFTQRHLHYLTRSKFNLRIEK